ncbi:MAG: DUF2934 domain-containing protein [Chthoniobacteraceae bacterium]
MQHIAAVQGFVELGMLFAANEAAKCPSLHPVERTVGQFDQGYGHTLKQVRLGLQMKKPKRFIPARIEPDNLLAGTPGAPVPAELKPEPTHEEIAVAAHQIYEEEGCPSGLAESHWEAAKSHLRPETFNGL